MLLSKNTGSRTYYALIGPTVSNVNYKLWTKYNSNYLKALESNQKQINIVGESPKKKNSTEEVFFFPLFNGFCREAGPGKQWGKRMWIETTLLLAWRTRGQSTEWSYQMKTERWNQGKERATKGEVPKTSYKLGPKLLADSWNMHVWDRLQAFQIRLKTEYRFKLRTTGGNEWRLSLSY